MQDFVCTTVNTAALYKKWDHFGKKIINCFFLQKESTRDKEHFNYSAVISCGKPLLNEENYK